MSVSLKCQYGLRALFELARRTGSAPTRIQEIAEAQASPPRFLDNILNQLRRGGFVDSRRGKAGGFALHWCAQFVSGPQGTNRYPMPASVRRCRGMEALSSTFLRRLAMCTRT